MSAIRMNRVVRPGNARRTRAVATPLAAAFLGCAILATGTDPQAAETTQRQAISPALAPAPEIFEVTGTALWDGQRTLQGIWVAHASAKTARRVRIFNTANGTAADGALFNRDVSLGGASVLISSDAAKLLGMAPGEAANLRIVAIAPAQRSATQAAPKPQAQAQAQTQTQTQTQAKPEPQPQPQPKIVAKPAPNVQPKPAAAKPAQLAPEAKAPGKAAPTPAPDAVAKAPAPTPITDQDRTFKLDGAKTGVPTKPAANLAPKPAAKPAPQVKTASKPANPEDRTFKLEPAPKADAQVVAKAGALDLPYIQAGTFGVKSNATSLVRKLKDRGIPAEGRPFQSGSKSYTRVLVGPFASLSARDDARRTLRQFGIRDAFPVRR